MIIQQTPLADAVVINTEPFRDHRGQFARFFCDRELASVLGGRSIVNVNFSRTTKKGTVRGMHFQRVPHQEMKLVRCIRGSVFDVIVDIRPQSDTHLRWYSEILTADTMNMLVIPEGFAHGFQTLADNSELLYLHTGFYNPLAEGGIAYNDPSINIQWPLEIADISERDRDFPVIDHSFQGALV